MDNGKYQHCKLSQVWKYRITFPLFKYFVNVMYLRQTLKGYYVTKELCCKETKDWSRFVTGVDVVYLDRIDSTVAYSNDVIYHTHWGMLIQFPYLCTCLFISMSTMYCLPKVSTCREHLRGVRTLPCISTSWTVNLLQRPPQGVFTETTHFLLELAIIKNWSLSIPSSYISLEVSWPHIEDHEHLGHVVLQEH